MVSSILTFSNFLVALLWISFAFVVGEFVSRKAKAWIPSLLIAAIVLLIGFWTFVPAEVVATSNLAALGGTVAMYMCISHMGTIIDFNQMRIQWKVVVICLFGLTGMIVACLLLIPIIGGNYVYGGMPVLTGGIVAMKLIQGIATEMGLQDVAVLAILVLVMQQLIGFPLAAICLKIESRKILKEFRESGGKISNEGGTKAMAAKKTLIPRTNPKSISTALILFKLSISAILAIMLGNLVASWIGVNLGAVFVLLFAMVFTELGFLDVDSLNKAGAFGFLMFAMLAGGFAGLANATPSMIATVGLPLLLILVVGVAGTAVMSFVAGKIFKVSFTFSFAMALNALFGFPPNAILTEETCKAMGETTEEVDYLRDKLLPSMLVAGFTCVTIASVIIAGVFVNLLS